LIDIVNLFVVVFFFALIALLLAPIFGLFCLCFYMTTMSMHEATSIQRLSWDTVLAGSMLRCF
jgi:hypothetical protein